VSRLPLQGFYFTKDLGRQRNLAPEALVAGLASQAELHVAHPSLKSAPEGSQLLFGHFKQHAGLDLLSPRLQGQMLPALWPSLGLIRSPKSSLRAFSQRSTWFMARWRISCAS
jgi:hypothetical protein